MNDRQPELLEELLQSCELEPIRFPGAVQPHGALLVVRHGVVVAAANLELVGAVNDEALGQQLDGALEPELLEALGSVAVGEPTSADIPGVGPVDAVARAVDDGQLIEVELPGDVDLTERTAVPHMLRSLQQSESVDELLAGAVEMVRELTGFERVMAYRFDPEWNGTVVAESVVEGVGTFLGLRYPASDIPPQARALYLRNRVRLIPDSHAVAVPLLTVAGDRGSVDLGDASLRAVSPVHLEYLRNMGVRASASIALVVGGELWGLIACHAYTGTRHPSPRIRILLDVIGGTVSALLAGLSTVAEALQQVAAAEHLDEVTGALLEVTGDDPIHELDPAAVTDLLAADGVVIAARGSVVATAGSVPGDHDLDVLLGWLDAIDAEWWSTDRLGLDPPTGLEVGTLVRDAAGLLALRWGDDGDWIVAVRGELVHSVRWGGNPTDKEVVVEPEGARLGPRRSFDEYVQTVEGTSAPWTRHQEAAARELQRRVRESVMRVERRDRKVAALMQRALLLDVVPQVPGADVAVTYRPAAGEGLGGDWFDVYFRADGCPVIALGDVAGHGMDVASTMGQLRHALRAYVMTEDSLGRAMMRLNELCCTLLPRDMATLVVARFDAERGALEIVNAGHLPPVRTYADGGAELSSLARNPALGISRTATFDASTVPLGYGDGLVLCTDGLIERKGGAPLDARLDELAGVSGRAEAATSRQLCDELLRWFDPDDRDDVTVLALRRA